MCLACFACKTKKELVSMTETAPEPVFEFVLPQSFAEKETAYLASLEDTVKRDFWLEYRETGVQTLEAIQLARFTIKTSENCAVVKDLQLYQTLFSYDTSVAMWTVKYPHLAPKTSLGGMREDMLLELFRKSQSHELCPAILNQFENAILYNLDEGMKKFR